MYWMVNGCAGDSAAGGLSTHGDFSTEGDIVG
jgi:hypothetical protein